MKKKIFFLLFLIGSASAFAQNHTEEALAYQYYQQGDFEKASVSLKSLFLKTKNDTYFELYLNSLLKIKNYEEAKNIIKKLLKQQPQKTNYLIALGRIYQETGETDKATKVFNEAIKITQKNEFHIRELANVFFRFEAYDMAIATFVAGRNELNTEQLFVYDLVTLYQIKRDKKKLTEEYVNLLGINAQMLQQAQSVLASIFDNNADYQYLQNILLKKIQKEPEVTVYAELLIWQYMQQQDYEMALRQIIAYDLRTKGNGEMIYLAANNFIANKAYAAAEKAYRYILTKGIENELYIPSKIQIINIKYEMATNGKTDTALLQQLVISYQDIITQYGISTQTLIAIKQIAYLKAYYFKDLSAAEKILEETVKQKTLSSTNIAQLKLDLGDIYVSNKQPWEAFLIYEQVAKDYENQDIGNEALFKSAKLSFFQGNFKYAKSQADVLKASTSKLIANDALDLSLLISDHLKNSADSLVLLMYANAELLQFMNRNDKALKKLDSIHIAYPNNNLQDDILMAKAKIYIKNANFTTAADLLEKLINEQPDGIWTDDAIFTLADMQEKKLNNPQEAKKLYQRLINDFPGSIYNAEARKRFRNLRGDNIEI